MHFSSRSTNLIDKFLNNDEIYNSLKEMLNNNDEYEDLRILANVFIAEFHLDPEDFDKIMTLLKMARATNV